MNKEELVKKMNDELFNSEIVDKEFFILSMIKQNIEERNEDDEIIKALSQYEKPLHTAYEIFTSYINMEQVLDKVFKAFFIKGQSHRGIIKDCMYCDEFYDDEFCDDEEVDEEVDEEDEGLIHDNEDC